jgi:hypothetical protein
MIVDKNMTRMDSYIGKNNIVSWGISDIAGKSFVTISFDPWTREWIDGSFEMYYSRALSKLKSQGKYIGMYEGNFDIETEGPEELIGKEWLFAIFKQAGLEHYETNYCHDLYQLTRGYYKGIVSAIEIPNIRVIAVLNKVEYGGWTDDQFDLFYERNGYQGLEEWEFNGWTPLDYCPFCGAKLPERLDKKIIEVLRDEYNLTSWEDYKKAPHEFHTDEWWRKRGL